MKVLNLVRKESSDIKFELSSFPDGQQQVTIDLGPLDKAAIEHKGGFPVEIKSRLNNWLDLERIACAVASLKEAGIKIIHLYVPYFEGSRSDRKFRDGGNNYLKTVICPIINSFGFESVTVLDPHSDVLEACINNFKKESNHSFINWVLANHYKTHKIEEIKDKISLVSPDAGAAKKIQDLTKYLDFKGQVLVCSKERDTEGNLSNTVVPLKSGEFFQNKDYIIVDDICDGGATFLNIAKVLRPLIGKEAKIYLIVTHGIFSKGFEELMKHFDGIYCTNSYSDLYLRDDVVRMSIGNMGLKDEFTKQLNVFN